MGNHQAGRAMGRMAEMALKMRTTQTALELLDTICEPYRGADAEFEAEDPNNTGHIHPEYTHYTEPDGPIGILMTEAFSPDIDWKTLFSEAFKTEDDDKIEAISDRWDDEVYSKFRSRYEFC